MDKRKQMLSENFSLHEMTWSNTAQRYSEPNEEQLKTLKWFCENCLQPIRVRYGKPVHVSSGYRDREVNRMVGGTASSHHMQGFAADITTLKGQKENEALYNLIKENFVYDQLIDENDCSWIHVSLKPSGKNRMEAKKKYTNAYLAKKNKAKGG